MKQIFTLVCMLLFFKSNAQEQAIKPNALNVFLDCSNYGGDCYYDYVRQELNLITFVRDRTDADVHLLLKSNWNSVGTQVATLFIIGKKKYEKNSDTLNYSLPATFTDDDRRKQLVKNIKMALLPYIAKTNLADKIFLEFKKKEEDKTNLTTEIKMKDPYNYWVFQFGLSGYYSGNQVSKDASANGYFSADRETKNYKSSIFLNANEQYTQYKNQGDVYEYDFQTFGVGATHIKKLNEHIAVGGDVAFKNSIFSNIKSQYTIGPRMEYSIFPYKKFNNIRWVFAYALNARRNNYYDTTIYLKMNETFLKQEANSIFSLTQEWGSINVGVFYNGLIKDWKKNALSFDGAISTKIAKGLNFAIWGSYSFIHNQINIRKGNATIDQLLAQNREILSAFNYNVGVGMSYRFGSKFNDAVNPTFKGLNYNINY